ncbi:hypothetical protein [Carboxylicivirga marina]|uniref:hypothetical protein n=1 Tax=Carboxylicivirga marina TaxID=2800988 RepID=UPI002595AD75|nr:hypothetical protein [uncultured Carboxylicivirga sp.]
MKFKTETLQGRIEMNRYFEKLQKQIHGEKQEFIIRGHRVEGYSLRDAEALADQIGLEPIEKDCIREYQSRGSVNLNQKHYN